MSYKDSERNRIYMRQYGRSKASNCIDCGFGPLSGPDKKRCKPCSKKGQLNPRWNNNPTNPGTGRIRVQRLYPILQSCEYCRTKKTERHHRDGNTTNNSSINIQWLCRRCHMKEDGRLETFIIMAKNTPWSSQAIIAAAKANRKIPRDFDLFNNYYWRQNMSIQKISQLLKISSSSVFYILKSLGIPIRTRSEAAVIAHKHTLI